MVRTMNFHIYRLHNSNKKCQFFKQLMKNTAVLKKLNICMIIYKSNVNWLCVCNYYLRQNCRVHIFTKKLLELIDKNKQMKIKKFTDVKKYFAITYILLLKSTISIVCNF